MSYFECAFDACGKEKASVLCTYRECKLLCVLNGPFEPSGKILDRFQGVLRISIHGAEGVKRESGVLQRYLEAMFSEAVHLKEYPRCVLDVKVYVLKAEEYLLSACINGISALLLGSGISAKGVPLGVHVQEESTSYTLGALAVGSQIEKLLCVGEGEQARAEPEDLWWDILERMKHALKRNYQEDLPSTEA
ncbi:hypothetical protein NECID01_1853 [Nematocida sp. AWRm77]|nr:hypothetical protein NECID01_1853 [Nematocida sp. AWRm77]